MFAYCENGNCESNKFYSKIYAYSILDCKCNEDKNFSDYTIRNIKMSGRNYTRKQCNICGRNIGNAKHFENKFQLDGTKILEKHKKIENVIRDSHMIVRENIEIQIENIKQNIKTTEKIFEKREYENYLNSDEWKEKRKKVLKRDNYI